MSGMKVLSGSEVSHDVSSSRAKNGADFRRFQALSKGFCAAVAFSLQAQDRGAHRGKVGLQFSQVFALHQLGGRHHPARANVDESRTRLQDNLTL